MRMTMRMAWIVSMALLGSGPTAAQVASPKPGPEHAKLARFVGTWTGTGETKASPFGPAGKMTWTETCEWFSGHFHIVCRSEGTSPAGEMKGLSVIGYDSEAKLYTWFGVDNNGWADLAKGTLQGKTWSFTSEMKSGGKTWQSRMELEEVGANAQKFRWETSEDGKTWTLMMDGESHK